MGDGPDGWCGCMRCWEGTNGAVGERRSCGDAMAGEAAVQCLDWLVAQTGLFAVVLHVPLNIAAARDGPCLHD